MQQTAAATTQWAPLHTQLAGHWQPAVWFGFRNGSNINITHVAVDELTESIYLGATNWLMQLSAASMNLNGAVRTGPSEQTGCNSAASAAQTTNECASASTAQPIYELQAMPVQYAHLGSSAQQTGAGNQAFAAANRWSQQWMLAAATMHTANHSAARQQQQRMQSTGNNNNPNNNNIVNNYNKLLLVDQDSRQLIVCGSLNQGACRRHQLGQVAYNYSDLINLPVASDDEHSSTVALVASMSSATAANKQQPVLYVAATNSRLNPNREMVPAISARYLDSHGQRSMQIVERSTFDSARLDIEYVLRDYYLVNYVNTFQHNGFVYFATVQRRSPLRELEEWGYQTRLARLCLNDLSFQSYVEITLECRRPSAQSRGSAPNRAGNGNGKQYGRQSAAAESEQINYNLLQDLHVAQAGSSVARHFARFAAPQSGKQHQQQQQQTILIGAFAHSKDHTWRPRQRSAICVYSMDQIESKFSENIQVCFNGTAKSRNMNYIAGSVNDCPRPASTSNKVSIMAAFPVA